MRSSILLIFATIVASFSISGSAIAGPQTQTAAAQTVRSDAGAQNVQGSWQGTLNSPSGKFRLVLKISKSDDGKLKASLDSPDQGAADLPVSSISFTDSYLHFEMKQIEAIFDGGLSRDGSEIAGEFRQGIQVPFVLKKEGATPAMTASAITKGKVSLEPCNVPLITKDAVCGKYEVFEDRNAKSGRKIALNIALVPAMSSKPAPDPVFILAGGPGQGAASLVKAAGDYLVRLRQNRDLVFIDQRGTGASNPLNCAPNGNRNEMRAFFTENTSTDGVVECRKQLEKVADLTLYTTQIAMDDLDEVRAALGYDKINILGGSYGTFAGLVFVRQHPDRVRTAILEGVSPVEAKIVLPFAKGVAHSLERLFKDCAGDKDCNTAFPNLRNDFKELTAKFDKEPAVFEATNLITQKREQVTMSRNMFSEQVRTMLYIPIYWRWLPVLIHEANASNYGPFAAIAYANVRGLTDQIAGGMSLSVLCAEDIPFISEAEIKAATDGTFYGDFRIRSNKRACEQWPRAKVPAAFNEPVKSDVPILMVTGDLDPVAPSWLAANAGKTLPNSRQITIPNTGHHFRFECIDNIFVDFLAKGTTKGLDDSCVKEIELPPFITKLPPALAK